MGKGYNNFMCKKPFHPASKDNMKRVWMAQQRDIDYKKKEDEMRLQYEKEQDLYNNRLLVAGSDSKDKLSLNFMYEAPPGVKKEQKEGEEAEPEYKFEWQRNAPRESFAKNNMDIRDQPFGIQVRNVRCLKCHKWGHVNTDRECPLYNSSLHSSGPSNSEATTEADGEEKKTHAKIDPKELMKSMREEQGLALKRSVHGNYGPSEQHNHSMLITDDPEVAFLNTLSSKEKKKLLKKLQELTNGKSSGDKKKSKDKKKKDKRREKEKDRSRDKSRERSRDDSKRSKKHHHHSSKHHRRD